LGRSAGLVTVWPRPRAPRPGQLRCEALHAQCRFSRTHLSAPTWLHTLVCTHLGRIRLSAPTWLHSLVCTHIGRIRLGSCTWMRSLGCSYVLTHTLGCSYVLTHTLDCSYALTPALDCSYALTPTLGCSHVLTPALDCSCSETRRHFSRFVHLTTICFLLPTHHSHHNHLYHHHNHCYCNQHHSQPLTTITNHHRSQPPFTSITNHNHSQSPGRLRQPSAQCRRSASETLFSPFAHQSLSHSSSSKRSTSSSATRRR
jgi:hypothetical protein